MKTLIYLILAFCHFLILSCNKISKEVTVTGTAKALQDDSPLVGYTIVLKELKYPLGGGVEISTLQSTTTDVNGAFSFTYEPRSKNNVDYEVEFLYGDDLFFPGRTGLEAIADRVTLTKKDEAINLNLVPAGEIKRCVYNSNPYSENDKIDIDIDTHYFINDFFYYEGIGLKCDNNFIKVPSGRNLLYILITKNNIILKDTVELFVEQNKAETYTYQY